MRFRNILDALIPRPIRNTRGHRQRKSFGVETLEVRQLLAADASVLKDILPGAGSSVEAQHSVDLSAPAELNGSIYFAADDGVHGSELWRTDGSESGTTIFADVMSGATGSNPRGLSVVNGRLLFAANGGELWVTDGTPTGTSQIFVPASSSSATTLSLIGTASGKAYYYFVTSVGDPGKILQSDGTETGTVQIDWTNASGDSPIRVTAFDGSVFVDAGRALNDLRDGYRIDEATSSTVPVHSGLTKPRGFTAMGSSLYFSGNAGSTIGVFKLNSAMGPPVSVAVSSNSVPSHLHAVGNTLYFYDYSSATDFSLWKSDGTASGTLPLKDYFPNTSSMTLYESIDLGGIYYAQVGDNKGNYQLWRSNGTVSGTTIVAEVFGFHYTISNGSLLFQVYLGSGAEAWTSDGTNVGTMRLASLGSFFPGRMVPLQNSFVFYGGTLEKGREPQILRIGETPAAPAIVAMAATTTSQRPTISWNSVGTNTDYDVWINNSSTREYRKIHQAVAGTSFVPPIDLGIGNVSVWVRTAGTATNPPSAWSSAVSFRILASVTQNDVALDTDKQPILSWVSQSGAAKYEVYIDRLDVPVTQIFRDATIVGTSLKLTTLPINGRYRVWVRGITADGTTGGWSAPKEFVARHVPVFTNSLNPTLDTSPTLTWTAVPGATTYDLYVVKIAGYVNVLNLTNISGTTTTLPMLPAGQYRYWVRASGAATWSNPIDLNTNGRTTVITPSGATTTNLPVISWQSVVDATGYDIQVDQIGGKPKYIYAENQTGTSANAATLANKNFVVAGNYRVWIRARNATTIGAWSPAVDFVVPNLQTEVLTPTGSVSPAQAFPITWRPIQGATSYKVLVYWLGVQQNYFNTSVSGAATSYTRATPLPAGNYRVWVKAIVPGSMEIYSDPVDFTVV